MAAPSEIDLLVFGPHPDDLEIGFGGSVALHAALGFRVGLCDLTRGELGSNGTPDERETEAEAACGVLGAAWRVNLRWPDGGIDGRESQILEHDPSLPLEILRIEGGIQDQVRQYIEGAVEVLVQHLDRVARVLGGGIGVQ